MILDGKTYKCKWETYKKSPVNFSTMRQTLSGAIDKNQATFHHYKFSMTLTLTAAELVLLSASFAKSPPNNKLAYTDRDSVQYYVYFVNNELSPKPISPILSSGSEIKYFCDIELYGVLA